MNMEVVDRTREGMERLMRGAIEPSGRWVRVKHGDTVIAESRTPLLLIQFGPNVMPTYFFTLDEINMDYLASSQETDGKRYWSVTVNGTKLDNAAWTYIDPPEHLSFLSERISFGWDILDWYEEAEQVFVHARDPHKRVDVMASTRRVQIEVDGEVIADTHRPFLLFETWLPTRYYIHKADVKMEFLHETSHTSRCPYKGTASYWTVKAGTEELENVAWSYPDPITENPKIKDLICFYNEKVDIYIDGALLPRPITPWS